MGRLRQQLSREEVIDLVAKKLNISSERIAMSQAIQNLPDPCDSLDVVELVMQLEDEFGQSFPPGVA
jgi:acyl carrier protein